MQSRSWEEPLAFDVHPTDFCNTDFSAIVATRPPRRKRMPTTNPTHSLPQHPTCTEVTPIGLKKGAKGKRELKRLKQSTLSFPMISREEWLERERQKLEQARLEKAEVQALIEHDRVWMLAERRGCERMRKQVYCKRKREDEIAAGIRGARGGKVKKLKVSSQ